MGKCASRPPLPTGGVYIYIRARLDSFQAPNPLLFILLLQSDSLQQQAVRLLQCSGRLVVPLHVVTRHKEALCKYG